MYLQRILGVAALVVGLVTNVTATDRIVPSALLTIDQNRSTVIERIVGEWGDRLASSSAGISPAQLREVLDGLRADALLAASLAGSLDGLRDVVATAMTSTAPVKPGRVSATAIGDTNNDLVYTPITPCRILDTRRGTIPPYWAPLTGGSAFPVSAYLSSFTPQGGAATNCNLPSSLTGIVVTLTILDPNFDAYLSASNTSDFATLTQAVVMNFTANKGQSNTAILPVDGSTRFYLGLPPQVTTNVIADAMGYFMRPSNYGGLHTISRQYATDSGGFQNTASGDYSVIAGGLTNSAIGPYSTVSGGAHNTAGDYFGTVSGGDTNEADGQWSVIGGGLRNVASGEGAVIGGGNANGSLAFFSTVSGGNSNQVTAPHGTIGGGISNTVNGEEATISGGGGSRANGLGATVGGGSAHAALGSYATVSGGQGNIATGYGAVVAGGGGNYAAGDYSFVAGLGAKNFDALHHGTFLFADMNYFDFTSKVPNEFAARATGGVRFVLGIDASGAPTWTCAASNGNSWACSSDRNLKENFRRVDGVDVLERLANMPVYFWNAKGTDASVKHMGPTAQDFMAAFSLGTSEKMIGMQDADGVALAAIQGLNQRVREEMLKKDREIGQLRRQLEAIEARLGQ